MRKIYFYILLVSLLFVIAGCTTLTQNCGDGICSPGEELTCSSDCGANLNNQPNLPTATINAPDTANVNDQINVTATITGGTAPYFEEFFKCNDITDPAVTMASQTPWTTIRCTYTSANQYKIVLQGHDNANNQFSAYKYITITSSSQLQPATYHGFVNPIAIEPPIKDPGQVTGQATSQLPTRYVIAKISGTEKARATIGTNGDYTIIVPPPSSPDPIITMPSGGFYVYFSVLDNGKEYPAGQYIFKSGQTITYDLHYSTAAQPQTETIYGYVNPSNSITANAVSQPPNTVKVTAKISGVTKATAYAYPNSGYYTFDVQGYVNDNIDFYVDDVFIKSVKFTGTRTKVDLTTQIEQPKNWEIFKGFINPIPIDPPPQIPPQSVNSINCGTKIKLSAKIAGAEVGYTCVSNLNEGPYTITVNYPTPPPMSPSPIVEFYIGTDKYGESYYHGNGITTTLNLYTPSQEPKDYETFTGKINPPPSVPPSSTTSPSHQLQLTAKIGTQTVGTAWVDDTLNNVPYTIRVDYASCTGMPPCPSVKFYINDKEYGSSVYTGTGKTTTLNLYTPAQNIPTVILEMPLVALPNQIVTAKATVSSGTTPYTITSFKCKNADPAIITTSSSQPPQTVFYKNCTYSSVGNYTVSVYGNDANSKTFSATKNIEVLTGGITQIELVQGWNFINIPKDNYRDMNVDTIFGSIENKLAKIYTLDENKNWLVWHNPDSVECILPPHNPACDSPDNLRIIETRRGYFVKADYDVVLDLTQIPKSAGLPVETPIKVSQGYNFLGTGSKFTVDGSWLPVGYKTQAWTFDPGQNKWVLIAISSAYDFTPGVGYAIYFNKVGEVSP